MRRLAPFALVIGIGGLLAARTAPAQEPTPEDAARAQRLAAALDEKRLTLDFVDAPVMTVFEHLRAQSGVNLVLDAEVRETFTWADTRVSLQLDDVTLRAALTALGEPFDLALVGRGDAVLLTRRERALADAPLRVRIYDIRDLCTEIRDHAGEPRDLLGVAQGHVFGDQEAESSSPAPDELLELVKCSCAPESWDATGASIAYLDSAFVVRAADAVHVEIAALLAELRAGARRRVAVTVQAILVDGATGRALRAAMSAPPAIDPAGEQALAAAIASGAARVLHSATLSGHDAQRIALRDGRQHVLPGLPFAAEGTTVQDGLTLDVRPVLVPGRGTVHCACVGQVSRLRPPDGGVPGGLAMDVLTTRSVVVGPLHRPLLLASGTVGAVSAGTAPAAETLLLMTVTTPGEAAKPTRQRHDGPSAPATGSGVLAKLAGVRVSPAFNDSTLAAALQFFRDIAGVNLAVDRRVFDDQPERALRVTLELQDVSGADALALLLDMTGLVLQEREGYGWITQRRESGGSAALAVYDVRDLTQPARVHLARAADLAGDAQPAGAWVAMQQEVEEPITPDQLADLIRGAVATDTWDTPPNSLEPKVAKLIVRNAPAVLDQVDRLLDGLRAVQTRPVFVEALHLEVTGATWEAAGLGRVLSAAEADAVAARAAAGTGMRLAAVARVAGLHGQGFTVHAGRQLVVEDAAAGRLVATDGVVVQVRPVIAADGRAVHCALLHRVQRADAAGQLRAGLAAAELQADVKVPAGGAVVLGGFAADGRPGSLVVLRVTPGH